MSQGSLSLFEQVGLLKEKFKSFFVHKKKLQALENYSVAAPFQHKDYLGLIRRCMADGFLGDKEADFLTYMIEKYEVNFLDWSHRTKWLKSEMQRLHSHYNQPKAQQAQKPQQIFMFDPERMKLRPSMNPSCPRIPFELLAQQQRQFQRAGGM